LVTITGAGTTARQYLAREYGPMPGSLGSKGMYRVPYFAGASVTVTLSRASLHLEKPGSSSSTLVIEKSTTADAFTAIPVATLTVAASGYTATDITSSLGTLASGNLLRFRWTSLGTGADGYHVQLEGTE
jgi:hypothetical protein